MTITATKTWTKQLVQDHAKTAVQVELYTLPFYLTALTSIKDTSHPAYKSILSICIEEMLHLQLAANLCLALDTKPEFPAPTYDGTPIPYLDPNNPTTAHHKLINAQLDALNTTTLDLMLDIETPSGLEQHRHPEKGIWKIIDWLEDTLEARWHLQHHLTPQYPYDTIGEMYNALIAGIVVVGKDNFSWTTRNQQAAWTSEAFTQIITKFEDAEEAVKTISLQGEGTTTGKDRYAIPANYRLENEGMDDKSFNEFSHYERLLNIKNQGLPEVYGTNNNQENQQAQQQALANLQSTFADLLTELDSIWNIGQDITQDNNFWNPMFGLLKAAQACWQAGVIPKWS
ncbi:hypothetical protein CLI64_14780 [Nostoc sp. CENA543]|uniref:ferritin-like domain-containing protein n=1 Tax=Nostoc sp. CENA543 TaxID=1869241 RepID=UPI000CA19925|nr:ferritin-like domain-containing protein [Nostoc sp. CENA543]AUT01551.1 hypothetical protein CLI64_14780 [Nostoc sp. CENA543]